jgi:hypothetical protein
VEEKGIDSGRISSNWSECEGSGGLGMGMSGSDLLDILDESGILEEVSAIKTQLSELIKTNERLSVELRFYRQKDLDKIFDF